MAVQDPGGLALAAAVRIAAEILAMFPLVTPAMPMVLKSCTVGIAAALAVELANAVVAAAISELSIRIWSSVKESLDALFALAIKALIVDKFADVTPVSPSFWKSCSVALLVELMTVATAVARAVNSAGESNCPASRFPKVLFRSASALESKVEAAVIPKAAYVTAVGPSAGLLIPRASANAADSAADPPLAFDSKNLNESTTAWISVVESFAVLPRPARKPPIAGALAVLMPVMPACKYACTVGRAWLLLEEAIAVTAVAFMKLTKAWISARVSVPEPLSGLAARAIRISGRFSWVTPRTPIAVSCSTVRPD